MTATSLAAAPRTRHVRRHDEVAHRTASPQPWSGVIDSPAPLADATAPSDHDFVALHTAYRRFGGFARSHELARVWAADAPGLDRHLHNLVDHGEVFGFHWHDSLWLPRFQLDRSRHGLDPVARVVLKELGSTFDGWELACWFVEPNTWLDEQCPLERLGSGLPAVLNAARADRFARSG